MKSEEVLVSICCATYNQAKYIGQCIDSFLMQKTNFKFEILIHDDASTDETPNIIKKYEIAYPNIIKPIFQNKNQYSLGINPFIKFLYPNSEGKYIAICEGDDYWTDAYKLQKQVDFLENNPEFVLSHTMVCLRKGNKEIPDISIKKEDKNDFESLLLSNQITTLTVLCKRAVLIEALKNIAALKDRKMPMGDYPLWLSIALNHKIALLKEVTGTYRVLEESASHTKDKQKAYFFDKSVVDVKTYFYKLYKNKNKITTNYKKLFHEMIFHARKRMILNYGNIAKEQLIELIKINPFFYFYIISNKLKRIIKKR